MSLVSASIPGQEPHWGAIRFTGLRDMSQIVHASEAVAPSGQIRSAHPGSRRLERT